MDRIEIGLSRARLESLVDQAAKALVVPGYTEFEVTAKENVAPYSDVVIHFSNDDMEREEARGAIFVEVI